MLIIDLDYDELEAREKEKEKYRRTRHNRERIINKRIKIAKSFFMNIKHRGQLAKYNLSCGCSICKMEKHHGLDKPQNRIFKDDQEQFAAESLHWKDDYNDI